MGRVGKLRARAWTYNTVFRLWLFYIAAAPFGAWATALDPAYVSPAAPSEAPRIYVVRRGWHVDLGFNVADVGGALAPIAAEFPGARYLLFGFGDAKYLLAAHHGPPVLLGALWPGAGLMLVTGLSAPPAEAFGRGEVIELEVSSADLAAALDFVRHSLSEVSAPLAHGPYEGSVFYRSTATYSALHTCNTWAAQGLKAAGLSVHSGGVLFAGQVWRQARRLRASQAPDAP
jgi:hypothetical protein